MTKLLCLLVLVIRATAAAEASDKIEPRLQDTLDALGSGEEVAIIIDFVGGVDVERSRDHEPDERRSELIEALKGEADRIQGPVASMLERNGVSGARQLWLSNQMAATVPVSLISELALQPSVERIQLDAAIATPLAHEPAAETRATDPDAVTDKASDEGEQPTTAGTAPPVGLRSTARTRTTVTLEWDGPGENAGVASYRLYELIRMNRFRSEWRAQLDGIAVPSTVVTGLEAGSRHEYAVAAVDDEGRESERSASLIVTTLQPPAAYHPVHRSNQPIVAIAGEAFSYDVDAQGIPPPTFSLIAGPETMQVDPDSGVVRWTPGAGDEGTVTATVRASNGEGRDDHSFSVAVRPVGSDLEAPSPVRMVVTRDTTAHGATLKWKPATDNVSVVGYRVLAQQFGRGNRLLLVGDTGAPDAAFTITTLKPETGYRLWVQPYDAAGNAATISGVPPANIITLPAPSEGDVQPSDP